MNDYLSGFLTCFVLFHVWKTFARFMKRDDSDSPSDKSGLEVCTDYKTGVQYLQGEYGGITPRLKADGSIAVVPLSNVKAQRSAPNAPAPQAGHDADSL